MLWRFTAALRKKLYLCICILWVTVGFLFKIQVALIYLTNLSGLLLLMQKWQTMTLHIEHQVIYTPVYFKVHCTNEAFPQHLESVLPSLQNVLLGSEAITHSGVMWPGNAPVSSVGHSCPAQTGLPNSSFFTSPVGDLSAGCSLLFNLLLRSPFCHLFRINGESISLQIRNKSTGT